MGYDLFPRMGAHGYKGRKSECIMESVNLRLFWSYNDWFTLPLCKDSLLRTADVGRIVWRRVHEVQEAEDTRRFGAAHQVKINGVML